MIRQMEGGQVGQTISRNKDVVGARFLVRR